MVTRTRSLVSVISLAFALLFFGPSTSNAQAKDGRGDGRGHAAYSRHYGGGYGQHYGYGYGHFGVGHGYGYISPSYGWGYGSYAQPHFDPYRTVRVFVPFPFPHWVFRRVYYGPPVASPYYSPY
jgi:hypothetical protein